MAAFRFLCIKGNSNKPTKQPCCRIIHSLAADILEYRLILALPATCKGIFMVNLQLLIMLVLDGSVGVLFSWEEI